MLEPVEASFDAVPLLVQVSIVASLHLATAAAGDDGGCSEAFDLGDDGCRVVALVGHHDLGLAPLEQMDGFGVLGRLTCGEPEGDRVSLAVGQQVDFGCQSTSGTPQSLVFGAPFLRPVAACW